MKGRVGRHALLRVAAEQLEISVPPVPNLITRTNLPTKRVRRAVVVVLTAMICVGQLAVLAPTVQAAAAPPRFLPTRLPWSYVVESIEERTTPTGSIQFMSYMRSAANDKAIMILSDLYDLSSWKRDARYLTDQKTRTTVVHGKQAFILDSYEYNNQVITWFDQGRVFTSTSVNVDIKTQVRSANAVVVNAGSPTGFSVSAVPAGLSIVYTGLSDSLTKSLSSLLYVTDPKNVHAHISVEVRRIDRRYIDVALLNPIGGSSTAMTINGKAGYETRFLNGPATFWWEEQPGLIVSVYADNLDEGSMLDVANSISETDEESWKAIVEQTTDFSANIQTSAEIINAGMVDGQAWTAQLAAKQSCLVYIVALKPVQACVRNTNSLGWSVVKLKEKTFAAGVAAANIETIVAKVDGVEVFRGAVTAVTGQSLLKLFIFPISSNAGQVSIVGFDVNGKEVQSPLMAGK